MKMTPKEELIQAIERSPDDLIRALLEVFRVLQRRSFSFGEAAPMSEEAVPAQEETEPKATAVIPSRLHRKQGILVIKTGNLDDFDVNTFINDVREERIQHQIGQINT